MASPARCGDGCLDDVAALNRVRHQDVGDPAILTRIEQYELAFRMQMSVPELTDISSEPQSVLDMYGPDVHKPGTYRQELLARPPLSRARRKVRPTLSHGLGPALYTCPAKSASNAATPTNPRLPW